MKLLTRRRFLLASAATAALGRDIQTKSLVAQDYRHPWNERTDPDAEGLTGYLNHGNLLVRRDNLPLLGYRAHPSLKYPYFFPLSGPVSGLPLVSESALPYPHHRGLWLGCEPLAGGDYWSDGPLESGQIRSLGMSIDANSAEGTIAFEDRCEWIREGSPSPLEDHRAFVVSSPRESLVILDCHFSIRAREEIEIARAKHSFFAVRSSPDIAPTYGGTLRNSAGAIGAAGTYGKPAAWCSYFGPRRLRPDVVEGITFMNHPSNFGGECPWFTRDYGHLSPQPFVFLKEPFHLARGETLELKYRIALHGGSPEEAGMPSLYKEWV